MSFHACQVMPKSANPTGQDLYLVCVTLPKEVRDEEMSGPDQNQEARMKFFDYQ